MFFGDLQPHHLSNLLLKDYANIRGVSDGTLLRELGTLKASIHFAEGNRWIEIQPGLIMPVKQPPPHGLWVTGEQVTHLMEAAKSHRIKLFIQVALATAARSGAILDLTWSQIDFEMLLIDFGKGWGNKRRSIVPMNDELYGSLRIAFELRQCDHVIEYKSEGFASIKSAFRRLAKDCKIEASPHVLRHTAAT